MLQCAVLIASPRWGAKAARFQVVTGLRTRYLIDEPQEFGQPESRHPCASSSTAKTTNWRARVSLAELVERLGLDVRKVAVERNLEIVPRSAYAATILGEGDRLEIVNFVGGG